MFQTDSYKLYHITHLMNDDFVSSFYLLLFFLYITRERDLPWVVLRNSCCIIQYIICIYIDMNISYIHATGDLLECDSLLHNVPVG